MKKIALLLVVALVICGTAMAGGGRDQAGADGTVRLRFGNVTPDSAVFAGEEFVRLAHEYSGGTLIIEHFPRNQLGNDLPMVENTIVGDLDISVSSTSSIAELYRDLYLFDAPFLFLDHQQAFRRMDGSVGQRILSGMESIGLKGLALWENGFRNFTNNRVPVRVPGDVQGFVVRTMDNEVHLAAWRAFGANPTPMAFGELFTALQQGTVDAQENPLGIIDANNFQSVQRHVSLTQHVYTPFIVVMNLRRYNALSPAHRSALDRAMAEATRLQREESIRLEGVILEKFARENINVVHLTAAEKEAWQRIVIENQILDRVKARMANPGLADEMMRY